jgi:hypothetical protein
MAPSRGAPQFAQKRPDAGAAQLGQVVEEDEVVDDMTNLWMEWRARAKCTTVRRRTAARAVASVRYSFDAMLLCG